MPPRTIKPPSARSLTTVEADGRRYTIEPARARIEYTATNTGGTSHAVPAPYNGAYRGDGDHWIVYSATGRPLALLTAWDDDYSTQPVRPRTDATAHGDLAFGNALRTGPDWRTLVGAL